MINVSSAWHRALWDDNRDYIEQVKITLEDETVLNLTNQHIWGGIKIDDAVSSDSDFQIGAAIINKLSFNINNIYDDYNEYDFGNAEVEVKIGLVTDTNTEIIKKGKFIVNTATYNGSLINLECYDYMSKFEKPYSGSTLVYPATLDTIVRGACTDCGVTLGTLNFPHKTYVISTKPSDENATYREVIAWCAQIAGCFARCDVDGKLDLKWYNQSAIGDGVSGLNGGIFDDDDPYSSGDTADGGTFNPWNTGYEYDAGLFSASSGAHYINTLYSKNISVDDVIITGVRIVVKTDGNTTLAPTLVGTTGYVVEISNNPMITSDNVSEIVTWLGTQLIGFKFRKAQITHGSDPSIEAGDVALVIDGKGNVYPIVISHTVFSVGASQSTVSSAQTPARNSASRVSNETKNYVELRKSIKTERTARQQAEYDLAQSIASASGLYLTTVTDSQTEAVTYYLHNKRNLNESAVRMMFSDVGITVTADSGAHWYGLTASGDMITNLLSATGINADWINTGQLVVVDPNDSTNEILFVDVDTGTVRIKPTTFTLTTANIATIESKASSAANTAKADAISTAASDATSKANAAEQNAKNYSDGQLSAYQTSVSGIVGGLQEQIDGKIQTWRQSEDPSLAWSDNETKAKHVGDIWYCVPSEDIIPSWLSPYVGTEDGMTALLSQRADDTWFSVANDVNFSIDGVVSTNIYIDSNSTFAFADTQPSTSGRSRAYNLNICRRDGQALSILNQLIEDGTHKAVKIKFSGYTEYSQSSQETEYLNEYEVFFTNDNEIYINTIKQPTYAYSASAIDTSIKDSGTTVQFSLVADTHASIKKVDGSWVTKDDRFVDKSWMYEEDNGVHYWAEMSSGVPQELLDEVDGKSSIYTTSSAPTSAEEGDLWFKSASDPIKTYHNGQWVEYNKYTDDTTANANLVTAKSYSDTNLASAKSYADTKVSTYDTNLNQQAVFNKLTNNGQTQGIFLNNNKVYINMSYATTGTLVVGGSASNPGVIQIKNSSDALIGQINTTGMFFGGDTWQNAKFSVDFNGSVFLQSNFETAGRYAKIGATDGFEVQGNGIKARLYASGWTYQQNDPSIPGAETPDYSENIDVQTRPGYYEYNAAFKVTDSSYSSRGTYTAIGKNYVEVAYTSKPLDLSDTYSYPSMCQLRSTNTDQALVLVRYRGDYNYERSVFLTETGFKKIKYYSHEYTPYTGNLVVGNTTYQVRGGIICKENVIS